MQYTRLGSSGLKVSRIVLGCMSFGDTSRGFNEWALDDEAGAPIFQQAVELGVTFWDTANAYGFGTSDQVALAWVLRNPVVTAPIVGPTKPHHLADAVAALDLELTDAEAAALEAGYTPRLPTGYE